MVVRAKEPRSKYTEKALRLYDLKQTLVKISVFSGAPLYFFCFKLWMIIRVLYEPVAVLVEIS